MRRALVFPLLVVALLCAASALAEKPSRDLVAMPKVPAGSVPIAGEYWALIVGIDKYQHAPPLDTAVKDAVGVRDVLVGRYGFKRERVIELFNEQATRTRIEDALYRLGQEGGPEDSDSYLVPSHIFDQIGPLIANNADQTPRSEPLRGTGDEGGQFVFRLSSASGGPLPNPPPRAGEGRVGGSAALTQAEQELKALEEQERQVEEQQKLAAVQQEIERKKQEIAKKKATVEEARVRPYEAPSQMGRELTGKDGAPMALVPAGEFLYGDNNHRMSLSAFYMDKYEVTTSRYAKFLQDTGREKPYKWNDVSLVSDGERPVIGVTWHDADAYCRQYGKRLPTEQEWEKAARGTDGRKYPWGNEEPNRFLASYDLDGERQWQGYLTLVSVESYESGKSPYGIYNMAGNVREWTSSDYDSTSKVLRGGSWNGGPQAVRSADRHNGAPRERNGGVGFRCAKTP